MQLVLHYDGAGFAGWQRQPARRTVQGTLEEALGRICQHPVAALGAGRTDAGVHARGQAAGVMAAPRWTPALLRRALNAVLPRDVWVAGAYDMREDFHARYSARLRRYSYRVGTDQASCSPFRRRWEWPIASPLDRDVLRRAASALVGAHSFRAFAVRGTAPATDDHRCTVESAVWLERDGSLIFEIAANRFLHHMVRFLVGTMIDMARGRRDPGAMPDLLVRSDNLRTSAPAPPNALFLDAVEYSPDLYLERA